MTAKRSIRLVIAVMLALKVSAACSKSRGASIVQLLATQKDFVGDRVIVNGYARSAGGTLRLYLIGLETAIVLSYGGETIELLGELGLAHVKGARWAEKTRRDTILTSWMCARI